MAAVRQRPWGGLGAADGYDYVKLARGAPKQYSGSSPTGASGD
jgi:hypothetical protein